MAKKKTLGGQRGYSAKLSVEPRAASSKPRVKLIEHDPTLTLTDRKKVLEAMVQCMIENDVEALRDILIGYVRNTSKTKLARETKLGRTTLYDLIDETKPFNPALSTLGPIFKSLKKVG